MRMAGYSVDAEGITPYFPKKQATNLQARCGGPDFAKSCCGNADEYRYR
jgi:hypothetical protein